MPPNASESRRTRILCFVLAALVPCLVVGWANGVFTYNHFYASGTYLRDAGWFSYTVYRQGLLPSNPAIVEAIPHYFSFHLSLVVSLASLLSYLFPGDRIGWYCLFQALVYAPLGCAAALLARSRTTPLDTRAAAAIGAAGLLFAFNGEALAAMGFPHFEVLLSAGICVMLAGLATGRAATSWSGLILAVATREDGGAHAATFLAAILACDLLGRPFPVGRRRLIAMIGIALMSTAVMMLVQKRVFHAVPLFQSEYLGEPAYAHVTGALLRVRFARLFDTALFVMLPFMLSCILAALARDGRWLLGWVVTLPWFVLNFLARQELKADFGLYTSFPFIPALFWTGAYACVRYEPASRLRLVYARFVAVTAISTLGMALSFPDVTRAVIGDMLAPAAVDAPAIRAYAASLRANPALRGKLLVDSGMACLLVDSLSENAFNRRNAEGSSYLDYDAVTFFRTSQLGLATHDAIANGRFTQCGALPRTSIVFCNRDGAPLPAGLVPHAFWLHTLATTPYALRSGSDRIDVVATERQELAVFGPFAALGAGRYRASFGLRVAACAAVTTPRVEVDVYDRDRVVATGALRGAQGTVAVDFDVPAGGARTIELRTFTGPCPYAVESVELTTSTDAPAPVH